MAEIYKEKVERLRARAHYYSRLQTGLEIPALLCSTANAALLSATMGTKNVFIESSTIALAFVSASLQGILQVLNIKERIGALENAAEQYENISFLLEKPYKSAEEEAELTKQVYERLQEIKDPVF